jgi:hypothetical protein
MTAERETVRALRSLFEDDLTVLPDRVVDAVLAELPVTRQQRRWVGWSLPIEPMRLAAATAVLVIAVTVSLGLFGGLRESGGGTIPPAVSPSPTASPTASPTSSPTVRPTAPPSPGYATAPADWPTPAVLVPASPLPKPAGSPLPANLIGRAYNTDPMSTDGIQAEVLTLRPANDPHCMAMFDGTSTCFTILWTPNFPNHVTDPAVRGPARIVDGKLVLGFALVPYSPECEGLTVRYSISADGWTLVALDAPNCVYPRFVRH